MDDPFVSVVTPVYNGAPYLRECIESVLAQTYPHWDYTIVNNCSTDGTLDIAQEYAARDPRIHVHTNPTFVRAIANHNIAFRRISPRSRYCKMVAADDWLYPECLEKMVALAERHPSVAIVGAYNLLETKVWYDEVIPYSRTVVPGRDVCRLRLLGGKYIFGAPTNVLFRADVVRRRPAFYNESNLHADSEANFEILEHHDFGFVHQVLTFRRERDDSLTSLSVRLNSYLPCTLYELVTYGPRYLGGAELERRIHEHLLKYYRYLGSQLGRRRGPQFWSFHRRKLAELGFPLRRARLAAHGALYVADLLLNPKSTAQRAVRRLRRGGEPGGATTQDRLLGVNPS